jgi:hypothetical protein
MPRANLWNNSVPRVELDQRARDARRRLERIEQLLVPRAAVTDSWLRRVLCLFSVGRGSRARRTRGSLNHQRPRLPQIQEMCGPSGRTLGLAFRHPAAG